MVTCLQIQTIMNIMSSNIDTLFEQVTTMYCTERMICSLLPDLNRECDDVRMRHALRMEAEENQRHCERLEGLINILQPIRASAVPEVELLTIYRQAADMLRRFVIKHLNTGYDTSILLPEISGRTDILLALRSTMKKEHTFSHAASAA